MLYKLGGRKFVAAGLITALFGIILVTGKISVDQFQSGVEWIYGLFVVGNIGEHIGNSLNK